VTSSLAPVLARTGLPIEQHKHPLDRARDDISDDKLIPLMAEHPQLLQRPIVERGDRAVLARPIERVLVLLDG